MGTTLTQRDWNTLTYTLMAKHRMIHAHAHTHSATHMDPATVMNEQRRTQTNKLSDMAGGTHTTYTSELPTEMLASLVTRLLIRRAVRVHACVHTCMCVMKGGRACSGVKASAAQALRVTEVGSRTRPGGRDGEWGGLAQAWGFTRLLPNASVSLPGSGT